MQRIATSVFGALALLDASNTAQAQSMVGQTVTDPCGARPQSIVVADIAVEAEHIDLIARSILAQEGFPKNLVCDFGQKTSEEPRDIAAIATHRATIYSDAELDTGNEILRRASLLNLDVMERTLDGLEALSNSGDYDPATVQEIRQIVLNGRRTIEEERARLVAP